MGCEVETLFYEHISIGKRPVLFLLIETLKN